jgi:hypothetical protein
VLRSRERRILEAFADALIPTTRRPGARDTLVSARLERFLAGFPAAPRKLLPLMLWAIELFPLGLGPIPRPFTWLSRAERVRALERLERHRVYPLRGAYVGLKVLSFIMHCEDPAVAAVAGWGLENARTRP